MSIQTTRNHFSLFFFINRSKIKRDGTCPILLRITINSHAVALSLKRSVAPLFWEADYGLVKKDCHEQESLNNYIDAIRSKANEKYTDLISQFDEVTPEMLRDSILGINGAKIPTIVDVWEDHNAYLKALIGRETSHANWQKYTSCLKYFKEFILKEYQIKDINIKMIDKILVSKFERYLKVERQCSYNTTIKYLQNFKKIIKIGINNGWISIDPFSHIKLTLIEVDRPYLDEIELQSIIEKKISIERLALVRDIFIFSCYTGLAYSDVAKLKKEEIQTSPDGFIWIRIRRQKTNVRANIPLLNIPLDIINSWCNLNELKPSDKIVPILSNQKMNSYLKEIADICGIEKNLCFHTARHTFATTVTLLYGVPIETVSKMLGHSSIKQSQLYARVVDKKVGEDMRVLANKINPNYTAM